MLKIERNEEGYLIEKDGETITVVKEGQDQFSAGTIFIVLGVFTLFEYSALIERSCEIFVSEAEEKFEPYLKMIQDEAELANVTLIKGNAAGFIREYFTGGMADKAERVKVLRNRDIYGFYKEKYMSELAEINTALAEVKKKDWINSAEELKEEMKKAVDGEKEVLALMHHVLTEN